MAKISLNGPIRDDFIPIVIKERKCYLTVGYFKVTFGAVGN